VIPNFLLVLIPFGAKVVCVCEYLSVCRCPDVCVYQLNLALMVVVHGDGGGENKINLRRKEEEDVVILL
jgi:hypothetical protein